MQQLKFLLLLLLTWFTSKVAPRQLRRNFRYNGTANKFRHLADYSMHDSVSTFNGDLAESPSDATLKWGTQSTDPLAAQLEESAKSTGLRMNRNGELKETDSLDLSLACNDAQTKLALSSEPLKGGSRGVLSLRALHSCGHAVSSKLKNTTVLVKDCDVTLSNGHCSTRVKYETADGKLADVTLPCTARHRSYPNDHHLDDLFNSDILQADGPQAGPNTPLELKCLIPVPPHPVPPHPVEPTRPRCNVDENKRIQCGSDLSSSECIANGCCYNPTPKNCTYPMDECTADKKFVFVIHRDLGDLSLDLTRLHTSGASACAPEIKSHSFVVFHFSTTECGVRTYDIGNSRVFSVEILTSLSPVPALNGSISRDVQFRLMVECRYSKSQLIASSDLVSSGFMVQSSSIYPMVQAYGLFSVQLRIAEDVSYTKFHPSYHQALRLLLGKSVYLEVILKSPVNPLAILLVHYCIAYPKTATKALVLLHDGCPNPIDLDGVIVISLPGNKHARRFEVKVFQFMLAEDEYLDEQIYFMCSTELCFPTPTGRICEEGCFSGS